MQQRRVLHSYAAGDVGAGAADHLSRQRCAGDLCTMPSHPLPNAVLTCCRNCPKANAHLAISSCPGSAGHLDVGRSKCRTLNPQTSKHYLPARAGQLDAGWPGAEPHAMGGERRDVRQSGRPARQPRPLRPACGPQVPRLFCMLLLQPWSSSIFRACFVAHLCSSRCPSCRTARWERQGTSTFDRCKVFDFTILCAGRRGGSSSPSP